MIDMKKFSFWQGFLSIFETHPPKIKIMSDSEARKADAKAIRSDWESVLGSWSLPPKEESNEPN